MKDELSAVEEAWQLGRVAAIEFSGAGHHAPAYLVGRQELDRLGDCRKPAGVFRSEDNFMTVLGEVRVIPEDLHQAARELRQLFGGSTAATAP